MRKLLQAFLLAAVALVAASASNANVLRWDGTLELGLDGLPPVTAVGGAYATVNGSSGLGALTALTINGGIAGTGKVPVTDPNAAPLVSLWGTMTLGAGTLAGIQTAPSGIVIQGGGTVVGAGVGTMPVQGLFKMCILFGGCISYIPVPLTQNGAKGVGLGGLLTVNGYGAGVNISVFGAPWTVHTAVVTGIPTANGGFTTSTARGWAHGPASASTATVGGVVQLVTPALTRTSLGTGTTTALFGILTIQFVPEPGTFGLFSVGVVGLAAFGRKRRAR